MITPDEWPGIILEMRRKRQIALGIADLLSRATQAAERRDEDESRRLVEEADDLLDLMDKNLSIKRAASPSDN